MNPPDGGLFDLQVNGFAGVDFQRPLAAADLARATADTVPSRDTRMLEFMELLAVFESSSRETLPDRYRGLGTDEVHARLDRLRAILGPRAGTGG